MDKGYQNLTDILSLATEEEKAQGITWYNDAALHCFNLSLKYDISIERVIGIVAALSPRCPWKENVIQAERFIDTKGKSRVTTYLPNKKKALAIFKGNHPLNVLNGHKVRAFYNNITDPINSRSVCIDSHMISCWFNKTDLSRSFLNAIFHPRGSKRIVIEQIRQAIINLSDLYHLKPLQVQAIIWLAWKRITGNKPYSGNVNYQSLLI